MKAAPFKYHAPRSLGEAASLLARLDDARPLAGGQSLMPMMNLRVAAPAHLVDLGRIGELRGVSVEGDRLLIGAMTTQRDIERSALVRQHCPLLGEAVRHVGHQQTRNRGTIGGSLCHLDPGAELPVAASALGATLSIEGPQGARSLDFDAFPQDFLTADLRRGEILTRLSLPLAAPDDRCAFVEFSRRPADFAIVSVAVQLNVSEGRIKSAAIALGGVSHCPVRLRDAEALLAGAAADENDAIEAAARVAGQIEAFGDHAYPADFRRRVASTLLARALAQALAQPLAQREA